MSAIDSLAQRFPEKRAFITGAASGFGYTLAEQLITHGWRVLLADINQERLAQAKEDFAPLSGTAETITVDVSSQVSLDTAAAAIKELWGGVDMVFNNAGIASCGAFGEITLEEWNRVIDIDLWSVIYGCRSFLPMLKEQQSGYIVNTASSAGTLSAAEMCNYNVAKAGVVSLSETLKVELSPFDIGVTVICPTVFKTNLEEGMVSQSAFEKNLQEQLKNTSVMPEHIADYTFKKMAKNALYAMPQNDAYWGWQVKRLFPELWAKLQSYCYKKRIWIYKSLK